MGGLTSIPGFKVGHAQDMDALTGCTVILCDTEMIGGVCASKLDRISFADSR